MQCIRKLENKIEVVYASELRQRVACVDLEPGMQVEEAIQQSGLLAEFPEIDITRNAVGIFGQRVALTHVLKAGDRVEIYRFLSSTPQEARRHRILKNE